MDSIRVVETSSGFAASLLGPGRLDDIGLPQTDGHVVGDADTHFLANGDARVDLDLGGVFSLQTLRLWNYNQIDPEGFEIRRTGHGVRELRIWADADSDGNGLAEHFTPITTVQIPEAPGRSDYGGELFDLPGVEARFVRLESLSNHGSEEQTGFSEILLRGTRLRDASTEIIDDVLIQSTRSPSSPDRRPIRTLGAGLDVANNAHDARVRGTNWEAAADDRAPSVTYDLSDLYEVGSMRIWNYNFAGGPDGNNLDRGAKTIDVYTSTDNQTFQFLKTINLDRGSGRSDDTGQAFDLDRTLSRYVRLDITESHGASGNIGLAEVRFAGQVLPAGDVLEIIDARTSNPNGAGSLVRAVNGSGLDDRARFHDNASANRYTSNFDTTPTLTFDFEKPSRLDKIHLWNFSAGAETDRGIRRFRLRTSVDGIEFVDRGVFETDRGGTTSSFYDAIHFQNAPLVAQRVQLEVIENWGDNAFTGLGEIRFFGQPIATKPAAIQWVPEADTGPADDDTDADDTDDTEGAMSANDALAWVVIVSSRSLGKWLRGNTGHIAPWMRLS
ncbi:MAG: discoidin domain-containing protein [Planctomycetota bacterium]